MIAAKFKNFCNYVSIQDLYSLTFQNDFPNNLSKFVTLVLKHPVWNTPQLCINA